MCGNYASAPSVVNSGFSQPLMRWTVQANRYRCTSGMNRLDIPLAPLQKPPFNAYAPPLSEPASGWPSAPPSA